MKRPRGRPPTFKAGINRPTAREFNDWAQTSYAGFDEPTDAPSYGDPSTQSRKFFKWARLTNFFYVGTDPNQTAIGFKGHLVAADGTDISEEIRLFAFSDPFIDEDSGMDLRMMLPYMLRHFGSTDRKHHVRVVPYWFCEENQTETPPPPPPPTGGGSGGTGIPPIDPFGSENLPGIDEPPDPIPPPMPPRGGDHGRTPQPPPVPELVGEIRWFLAETFRLGQTLVKLRLVEGGDGSSGGVATFQYAMYLPGDDPGEVDPLPTQFTGGNDPGHQNDFPFDTPRAFGRFMPAAANPAIGDTEGPWGLATPSILRRVGGDTAWALLIAFGQQRTATNQCV